MDIPIYRFSFFDHFIQKKTQNMKDDATTLTITTLNTMTLFLITLSISKLSTRTLGMVTLRIITHSLTVFSIMTRIEARHNDT